MKKTIIAAAATLLSLCAGAHTAIPDRSGFETDSILNIDSTVVTVSRAGVRTPVAHTGIGREKLEASAPAASLPMLLGMEPSVVATCEGGTGLGYSKFRVRGSDPTRTNVTLNGVVLNDAESQQVFWVNIPSIAGMLSSVQLQRGVGTSVNGPGAFGASLNMETLKPSPSPYCELTAGGGSFLTGSVSAAAGSGRSGSGISLDLRLAAGTTDGYVDNGYARLHSVFATASVIREKNSFTLDYIFGRQHSGITWEGCPSDIARTNPRANPRITCGRERITDGDSDNYTQHHIQGVWVHSFSPGLSLSSTFNFTPGRGYYEYAATADASPKAEHLRYAMANEFYAVTSTLKNRGAVETLSANVSYSIYDGRNSGHRVLSSIPGPDLYRNNSLKRDFSIFLRSETLLWQRLNLYADIQWRHIDYRLAGIDMDLVPISAARKYGFFNPKAGASFEIGRGQSVYASFAVGRKEASRTDLIAAIKSGRGDDLGPETLFDWEAGFSFSGAQFSATAGIYLMEYRDQLLETGKISEEGYSIKENVPESHRRGIELSARWKPTGKLRFDGNLALSVNRILDYTAYVDHFDSVSGGRFLGQIEEHYPNTTMLMSPSVVGMAAVTFNPIPAVEAVLAWKYVGKQYWDNTACDERCLPAYDIFNLKVTWKVNKTIKFAIFADNLLSKSYAADAWVYRAYYDEGGFITQDGVFPQAPISVNAKVTLNF